MSELLGRTLLRALVGAVIGGLCFLMAQALKGGRTALPATNGAPELREVTYPADGSWWEKHTYLIHTNGSVLHAEHCRCGPRNISVVVTNVVYRTNEIVEFKYSKEDMERLWDYIHGIR